MVVHFDTNTDCSLVGDMEQPTAPHPDLLIAKREPGTDSPKRCRPVLAKSALEPVDEEPSISDMKEKGATTVDRGVGPTPLPPGLGDPGLSNSRKPFTSPFLPGSPLEQSAYQHSLALYYAQLAGISPLSFSSPSPVGQPLSANTHEGRYLFNHGSFHHPSPARVVGSPTQSDISLFSNPAIANSMDRLAAQMHWDRSQRHLQQMGSPFSLADITKKSSASADVPATPQSGSVTLPPSLNSSRLTSPRPSLVSGRGRKRALSHSPLSEFLDIQSLTRSSEGSLHFTPLLHNTNSRSSSAASGSYGHLSAGSLASLTPTLKPTSPFLHPMYPMQLPFPVAPFQTPTTMHLNAASISQQQLLSQQMNAGQIKQETVASGQMRESIHQVMPEKGGGSAVVSSTVPGVDELPQNAASIGVKGDAEDESQDFKETNCRWYECTQQFALHDDLVKHVNQDHISSNRKTFICRWRECCRQEKPFKAQYMLVVHMRRHTGEKPHKCQGFPGCNKAYSRLENLKTHMRSHTGERPYLCEYPGCQKAFSNASDRAKHQNRTHSNEKPYACEIDGCSKRYTDPSSLRKHVKTVHGAEFYARKKHKGLDTPGCRANNVSNVKSDSQRGVDRNCVEECLTVTGLGSNDRRHNQGTGSIAAEQQGSPQSDIDVGIHVMKEERIALAASPMDALQETIAEQEPYSQQGEGGQSLLVAQRVNTRNLKPKLSTKSSVVTSLPSIPNVFLGEPKNKVTAVNGSFKLLPKRQLPEILEPSQKQSLGAPRRDSNTSTLSSYMSSVRSEHSPAMFNSRFSSRRSSETSQLSARLSIINSPYEYDIAGNLPDRSSRELNSVTDQMEKARLGSQPNLCVKSQSMSLLSPAARHDGLRRDYRRGRDNDGWRTATPAHTPLPHEYPQHERRRASDPVRCVDPNFSELKKLQTRYYSLNAMKPLPIPNSMKSLRSKKNSQETFQSSHSSVYTNGLDANGVDYEAMLNIKMIEDNDDVIIPDDMKQFLQQRQADLQQNRPDVQQQGNATPTAAGNGSNTVDDWVQQTNSVNHHITAGYPHNRQAAEFDYHNTGHYPAPPQYGVAYDHQHGCCNNPMYSNINGDPRYGNVQPPCYAPYQCHSNMYPPGHMCHGAHAPNMHHANPCNHSAYNQTCLMPPPAPVANHTSPRHNVVQTNHQHPIQHNMSTSTAYDNHRSLQATAKAAHHHMLVNQQLSPPCEVTSSTDRNPQVVPNPPAMDNMSSVSATDMQSQASHLFSSVSQIPPNHGDSSSNMVINNMTNVLSQFSAEENKYLNSQH